MAIEMERIMLIRQEGTVKKYCDEFKLLFDLVKNFEEMSEFYAIYLFMDGLEPKMRSVFMRWHQYSFHTLKDYISLALKLDENKLRDSFSPYDPNSAAYDAHKVFDVMFGCDNGGRSEYLGVDSAKDSKQKDKHEMGSSCQDMVTNIQETFDQDSCDSGDSKEIEHEMDSLSQDMGIALVLEIPVEVSSETKEFIDNEVVEFQKEIDSNENDVWVDEILENVKNNGFTDAESENEQGNQKKVNKGLFLEDFGGKLNIVGGDNSRKNATVIVTNQKRTHGVYSTDDKLDDQNLIKVSHDEPDIKAPFVATSTGQEGTWLGSTLYGKVHIGLWLDCQVKLGKIVEILGLSKEFHSWEKKLLKWSDTSWISNLKCEGGEIMELAFVREIVDKNKIWKVGLTVDRGGHLYQEMRDSWDVFKPLHQAWVLAFEQVPTSLSKLEQSLISETLWPTAKHQLKFSGHLGLELIVVKTFEWKPSWHCSLIKKLRKVQHDSLEYDAEFSIIMTTRDLDESLASTLAETEILDKLMRLLLMDWLQFWMYGYLIINGSYCCVLTWDANVVLTIKKGVNNWYWYCHPRFVLYCCINTKINRVIGNGLLKAFQNEILATITLGDLVFHVMFITKEGMKFSTKGLQTRHFC